MPESWAVEVNDLHVTRGGRNILEGASFKLDKGRFLALLGPSGSGKTTLLRAIAGFIKPTKGEVHLLGERMIAVPPERRPVSMLFQNPVLFPNLTVEKNALVGLPRKDDNSIAVKQLARAFQVDERTLGELADEHLSGGERQRAALIRTFASAREILLLDEPLKSALNIELRWQLMRAIKDYGRRDSRTTVLVTHEFEEAAYLADEICVLTHGKTYVGSARAMYFNPPNLAVARVLGQGNEIPADLLLDRDKRERYCPMAFEGPDPPITTNADRVFIRPSSFRVTPGTGFKVIEDSFLGEFSLLKLRSKEGDLVIWASAPAHHAFIKDGEVGVILLTEEIIVFDPLGAKVTHKL